MKSCWCEFIILLGFGLGDSRRFLFIFGSTSYTILQSHFFSGISNATRHCVHLLVITNGPRGKTTVNYGRAWPPKDDEAIQKIYGRGLFFSCKYFALMRSKSSQLTTRLSILAYHGRSNPFLSPCFFGTSRRGVNILVLSWSLSWRS